ncbi:MAG: hypothetical protein PHP50_08870 [Lachnospiraceae bacterium]|nr:hypothetical protein [Lachnospiraceae bacterium]
MKKKKVKHMKERDEIMTIKTYNKQHNETIQEMQNYIDSFKTMDKNQAKARAKKSLIRSGVLTQKGTMKKQICK